MKKQKNPNSRLELIKYGFKLVYSLDKKLFPISTVRAIFRSLLPLVPTALSADIVNGISAGKTAKYLIIEGIITAVLTAALYFADQALMNIEQIHYTEAMNWECKAFAEKHINADFELLEDAHFKELSKTWENYISCNGGSVWTVISMYASLLTGFIGLAASAVILFPTLKACFTIDNSSFLTSWKMLAILGGAIVVIGASLLLLSSTLNKKTIPLYGMNDFFYAQFCYWFGFPAEYKNGKEIRLYNAEDAVVFEAEKVIQDEIKTDCKMKKVFMKYQPFMLGFQGLIGGVLYFFIALKAFAGVLAPGSIVLCIGAMDAIVNAVNLLGGIPMYLGVGEQRMGVIREVLEADKSKYKGSIPVEKRNDNQYDIEFKNVTFAYPGTDAPVLKNFSIKLKIGERLAIVGRNGSGKTTFIKLLCRFYDPQEGQILLNGIDIKKYSPEEYASIFSVVFQDFKIFSAPLDKNVTTSLDYDSKRLWDSLEKAGIADRVRSMHDKEKTVLYKDFDKNGVDISGGEAQKLALARALYKDAPFIILDEPTAALDPIAEADIYQRFNSFVGEKTAVYISHRLSSCRFCDKIAVFDNGQLVQTGSHEELIAQDGVYEKLWNAQAQYYV